MLVSMYVTCPTKTIISLPRPVSLYLENSCSLARNCEGTFSFEMLLHPPTPLLPWLNPVNHPLDLQHPLWSQLTDEHTWNQALLNRPECLCHCCFHKVIWILHPIHKWEPTGWVRTLGFSTHSLEQIACPSTRPLRCSRTSGPSQVEATAGPNEVLVNIPLWGWALHNINRELAPESLSWASLQTVMVGAKAPHCAPPACPPQESPAHCGLGSYTLGLASVKHLPLHTNNLLQTESSVWDTGAREVSKGEGRKSSLAQYHNGSALMP